MKNRLSLAASIVGAMLAVAGSLAACCPAGPKDSGVVNADQTVILIWDPATKMQHFIRQATFRSSAEEFAFLVPSPSQPELAESGNDAFPYLSDLTKPEIRYEKYRAGPRPDPSTVKKSAMEKKSEVKDGVKVLERKRVAGFDATVLESTSAKALADWLKENGFAFTTAIEAWAKPYVEQAWKFTALKVAKDPDNRFSTAVSAKSLRMSYKTDRPLFPYREPESGSAAETLNARNRMLRIFFLGDARYGGELTKTQPWTGKVAWAGKIRKENCEELLKRLKLPGDTGPAEWHLTEFEDNWPYRVAEGDVYFSRSTAQDEVRRPPIIYQIPVYDDELAFSETVYPWIAGGVALVIIGGLVVFGIMRFRRR